jgi:hypothetical protein
MRVGIRAFLFALAVVALTSREAGADWLITGFGGANAEGATDDRKVDYGASLGFMLRRDWRRGRSGLLA